MQPTAAALLFALLFVLLVPRQMDFLLLTISVECGLRRGRRFWLDADLWLADALNMFCSGWQCSSSAELFGIVGLHWSDRIHLDPTSSPIGSVRCTMTFRNCGFKDLDYERQKSMVSTMLDLPLTIDYRPTCPSSMEQQQCRLVA